MKRSAETSHSQGTLHGMIIWVSSYLCDPQSKRRGTAICTAQTTGASTVAGVALGGSVRNSVEVCKGAAWYAPPPRRILNALLTFLAALSHPPSGRHVSTSSRAHRGLCEAVVTCTHVPSLLVALRDRLRTAEGAECVDRCGPPGRSIIIWRAVDEQQREEGGKCCCGSDSPPW